MRRAPTGPVPRRRPNEHAGGRGWERRIDPDRVCSVGGSIGPAVPSSNSGGPCARSRLVGGQEIVSQARHRVPAAAGAPRVSDCTSARRGSPEASGGAPRASEARSREKTQGLSAGRPGAEGMGASSTAQERRPARDGSLGWPSARWAEPRLAVPTQRAVKVDSAGTPSGASSATALKGFKRTMKAGCAKKGPELEA